MKAIKEYKFKCEGCGVIYGEYINGCVFCWDDNLTGEENLKKYPNRGVRPMACDGECNHDFCEGKRP